MKLKKFVIFLMVTAMISLLTACGSHDEKDVEKYLKKKYDIEVQITETPRLHTGNMGDSSFTVIRKDIPDVSFSVFTEGLFFNKIASDNYEDVFEVYQSNVAYQESNLYKELLKRGIHSFVSHGVFISEDFEESSTGIDIILTKDNGFEISEKNHKELYSAFQKIKEYHGEKYKVGNLYIVNKFDTTLNSKYKLFKNFDSYHTINILLDDLNTIVHYEDFKKVLASEGIGKSVENHFYNKDFPALKKIKPELASLKLNLRENYSEFGYSLRCDDYNYGSNSNSATFDSLNLTSCKDYVLSLDYNAKMSDGITEEATNLFTAIKLIKNTELNINTLIIKFEDLEKDRDYHLRVEMNLDEIDTIEDIRTLLGEQQENI